VKHAAALSFIAVLIFAGPARAQDDKPLGDVAREARAAKASEPKAATVVTNDNIPAGNAQAGTGKLSPDKQAFCNYLRQRKDTAAEQGCMLLGIDMGSEYEELTARYVQVAKRLCGASGGHGLPTSVPSDPALAAQFREGSALYGKFMEMMKAEMKTLSDAEGAENAVRQEEFGELARNVPDWQNTTALLANPQEKQRFNEIHEEYRPRIQEKDEVVGQIRRRGVRFLTDEARTEHVCEY
jgi:hypothetical protein